MIKHLRRARFLYRIERELGKTPFAAFKRALRWLLFSRVILPWPQP